VSALLTVLATIWKVPALRWPALVLAGMLALWGYVEVVEWRAGNEAVEEAVQETKDDMEALKNAARDGRDAIRRCLDDGGVYDHGTGRCQVGNP
jgi:diacylglycerol kinase